MKSYASEYPIYIIYKDKFESKYFTCNLTRQCILHNFPCHLQFKINHPESEDLSFLYGTILTDGKDPYSEEPTTNICVFADEQVLKL